MPRIRCHYADCVFLDDGYCSAAQIEIDPDSGCMTYNPTAEAGEEEWEEEEEELEEWEEIDEEDEEDDDLWLDEEEEKF
jgi:hypothetical protein